MEELGRAERLWQTERASMQEELRRSYDMINKAKEQVNNNNMVITRLEGELSMKDSRIEELKGDLREAQRRVRANAREVDELQKRIANLEDSSVEEDKDTKDDKANERLYYYIIAIALVILGVAELVAARSDARQQVYSVEAKEEVERLTLSLEETKLSLEGIEDDRESLKEQLKKALIDKEESALALADSLQTLASSRDEFRRFSEDQLKKESALLERLADSQSVMSSARSMASQAYDMRISTTTPQQEHTTALVAPSNRRPLEYYIGGEGSTAPPSNVSSAVYPPSSIGSEIIRGQNCNTKTAAVPHPTSPSTPIVTLPSFTPMPEKEALSATEGQDAYDTAQDELPSNHRPTKCSSDDASSAGVAEAVGGLATPRGTNAATSVVLSEDNDITRYDPYEEEQSWLTAGSPTGVISPANRSSSRDRQQQQQELSPLTMETPLREDNTDNGDTSDDGADNNLPDVVSNIEAWFRAGNGMSPLDVASEAPSANRLAERRAAMKREKRRSDSIDRSSCPSRTPRTMSPRKSTPSSTPAGRRGPHSGGMARPKANPKAVMKKLPLGKISFTGGSMSAGGYSRRLPDSSRRRGSTGSLNSATEDHDCGAVVVLAGSGHTKGGRVRRGEVEYASSSVTPTSSVKGGRESRLHQCVQIIKASDFGSRCSDKRYIGWVTNICRHQHDRDAVSTALCDIAAQPSSSGGIDPHRCGRVLKVVEDFINKGDFSSGIVHLTQSLLPFLITYTDTFINKKEIRLCQATFIKFATLLSPYIQYKDTSTVPTEKIVEQCETLISKLWKSDKSRPWIAAIGRDLIRVLLPISKCNGVTDIWHNLTTGDKTGRRLAKVCSLSTPYWLHKHLISQTEEEELSALFSAFVAGSQKQMQDQYFEKSFKSEGHLLQHHVINTTRAVLCGDLHNLDTEGNLCQLRNRYGGTAVSAVQAYFRLSLIIDPLLGAAGEPVSVDGSSSNVDEDALVRLLISNRDDLISHSYREWDPQLPPPITPKVDKEKPTVLDAFMPVHDLIYEELPTQRSIAVPLLVVLGLSIDNFLPEFKAAGNHLSRQSLASSVSQTLFQCTVETLRRGRDYSNDTLVGRVEVLGLATRLPESLQACFGAVSKCIDMLCASREEYDTPEWIDKSPRAVLQRLIMPEPEPAAPPIPAATTTVNELDGPIMDSEDDDDDDLANYSEISDTESSASVMTETAPFPEPQAREEEEYTTDNTAVNPAIPHPGNEQLTTEVSPTPTTPAAADGCPDEGKGGKVMKLLMLLQKGQQG
ncbi:hypothetical protein FOL47_008055 [Perkinsus chesapeaki]|uniref:Integrator complex subunit 3 N-terminal domain-containing protein n=1 Tax=Perkinsus chesapeaki TaxID=330153 RepID=A0A7J6N4S6_PERCH|nr:hypothetical protein FOL47_008055 [Perkinsus chesapeaki]